MIGSAVIQLAGDRSSISRQYPNGGGGRSLTYHCRLPSADISIRPRCRRSTFLLYTAFISLFVVINRMQFCKDFFDGVYGGKHTTQRKTIQGNPL